MVLLGNKAQGEARFGLFGDTGNLDTRLVHGLRQTYHGSEIILAHQMVLLGDEAQVEPCFGPFGDSANLNSR